MAWYLQQIKAELIRYNNIIVGSGNSVKGNGNFVIGSNNTLQGNNFWVFDSGINRQGIEDGVLII